MGGNGHGGARKGAGRPPKWSDEEFREICDECEEKLRKAKADAFKAERERLFGKRDRKGQSKLVERDGVTSIEELWSDLPVHNRSEFLQSEEYQDHKAAMEQELHALHGTDAKAGPPRRGLTICDRPPRGTRKRIIEEVAKSRGLKPKAVERMWDQYRRWAAETKA